MRINTKRCGLCALFTGTSCAETGELRKADDLIRGCRNFREYESVYGEY